MHIFIDESGVFAKGDGPEAISAVGALIVPSAQMRKLERRYAALRADLPKDARGEVKGRLLAEAHIRQVVDLLDRHEALFEAKVVDLGLHTAEELAEHWGRQAEAITANLTPEHNEVAVAYAWERRRQLDAMPLQQYVQAVLMITLIDTVVRHATLYFAQRLPAELGAFHWVVDAKEPAAVATFEDWWSVMILPALMDRSRREPLGTVRWADYSHFERFRRRSGRELPDRTPIEPGGGRSEPALDIGSVVKEDFRFSSAAEPGLELVDILTTGVRRALRGHLGEEGWSSIPRLMINRAGHCLGMVLLSGRQDVRTSQLSYRRVLTQGFRVGGRTMGLQRIYRVRTNRR
jgi:hypothetical protein